MQQCLGDCKDTVSKFRREGRDEIPQLSPSPHLMYPWHLSPSPIWWLTNMPAPWNGSGTDHQSIGASLWPQPDVSGSDVARVTPLLSESLTTIRRLAATCHQGSQLSQCRPIRGQWWGSIDQSEARYNLMKCRNVKSYANVMVQCTLDEHWATTSNYMFGIKLFKNATHVIKQAFNKVCQNKMSKNEWHHHWMAKTSI